MSLVTLFWRAWAAISGGGNGGSWPPSRIVKWVPIEWAVRLRTLQRGTLNVGNTRQNKANLIALATTEANARTPQQWARWNPVLPYKLQVYVRGIPGYVPPAGTNL